MDKKRVVIGLITYGQHSLQYLSDFLAGLEGQTYRDYELVVLDNSEAAESANYLWLRQYNDNLRIIRPGVNLGFGAGFNLLIRAARELEAEYFFVANADTYWQPDALALLVSALETKPSLAAAAPKVLQWDFKHKIFSGTIDTCGLVLRSGLRFIDLGQGEVDAGQYDQAAILGPSGCAGLWRLSVLEQIKEGDDQYFDANFFMYKEDCDLAYRLNLAGWSSALVSQAIVYHERTASGGASLQATLAARAGKSRQVKKWSFLNQLLLWTKYWHRQSWWQKVVIVTRCKLTSAYALLFEPYLLPEFLNWWRLRTKLKRY